MIFGWNIAVLITCTVLSDLLVSVSVLATLTWHSGGARFVSAGLLLGVDEAALGRPGGGRGHQHRGREGHQRARPQHNGEWRHEDEIVSMGEIKTASRDISHAAVAERKERQINAASSHIKQDLVFER